MVSIWQAFGQEYLFKCWECGTDRHLRMCKATISSAWYCRVVMCVDCLASTNQECLNKNTH